MSTAPDNIEEEPRRLAFDKPRLVTLCLVDQNVPGYKTFHCQTIAMSLFEAMANARTRFGRDIRMNSWGSRSLPGFDGCQIFGGGEIVPGKWDRTHQKALSVINP